MDYPDKRQNDSLKAVFLIITSVCLGYSNTLGVGFFYDDLSNIVRNDSLKTLNGLSSIITGERPVGMVTFALNYRWGGLDVTGYHIFNILTHILNCVLAYFLLVKTFTLATETDEETRRSKKISLLAALLFSVHPIQTQAVTYIVQRTEILSSAFMLLTLISFAYGATSSRPFTRKVCFSLTVPLYLFGFFTKEIAITIPLLILTYDFFFLSEAKPKKLLQRFPVHLALFSMCVFFTISKLTAFQQTKGGSAGFVLKSISSGEYLLTQSHVIWTYIRLIFFPFNQNLDYDYPISRSLSEFSTLLPVSALIVFFSILIFFIQKEKERRSGASPLFFTLWFFIILLPTTSFIPILDVIYEHRLYLPSLGAFTLISTLIYSITGRVNSKWLKNTPDLTVKTITFAILFLLLSLTFARNRVWSDPVSLWEDTVSKSPRKARPYNNLGNAYINKGNYDKAIFWLNQSIKADPMYMESHFNIGLCNIKKGNILEALPYMKEVVRINSILKTGHFGVSYNKRLDLMAHANLGNIYNVKGEYQNAIRHFRSSLAIDPSNTSTLFNLGITYKKNRNTGEAIKTFEKILRIDQTDRDAKRNLFELRNRK